jgi:putative phosphoesterase
MFGYMQEKFGLISDIHGNDVALKAVLAEAKRLKVSELIFLGDIVGYYYKPKECLAMLSDWDVTYIRGNHEIMMRDMILGKLKNQDVINKYGNGLKIACLQLSEDQIEFLINLPDSQILDIGSKKVLACHGTPWDKNAYLYPDSPSDILSRCNSKEFDFLLTGHTHYQMVKKLSKTTVVNPGSIGQQRERNPGAAWATIDFESGLINLQRQGYELSNLIKQVEVHDPQSTYLKEVLTRQ